MTLKEFKNLLDSKKKGDLLLPKSNDELKPLIQESLEYIAKKVVPIDLLTSDTTKETLRWVSSKKLIRKPNATVKDEDIIDIDEQLTYATAYDLLSNRTNDLNKSSFYIQKREEELNIYMWNNFKFLQDIGV